MATVGPATFDDLVARSLVPIDATLQSVYETLLDDAYAVILAAVPSLPARLADPVTGASVRALVIQVQCSMVGRVAANPEGKLQETIDDYSWRRDSAVSTGALYLSDAELALLTPVVNRSAAYTIRPA